MGNHWDMGPVSVSCLTVLVTSLTVFYDTPEEFLYKMCVRKAQAQGITYKSHEINKCEVQNVFICDVQYVFTLSKAMSSQREPSAYSK